MSSGHYACLSYEHDIFIWFIYTVWVSIHSRSHVTQVTAHHIFVVIAGVAEGLVFVYMGMSLFTGLQRTPSVPLAYYLRSSVKWHNFCICIIFFSSVTIVRYIEELGY